MPTSVQAIYQWLSGATLPRLTHAARIIELSEGRLSVADILAHYTEVTADGNAKRRKGTVVGGAS
jgi:hypothetical protein